MAWNNFTCWLPYLQLVLLVDGLMMMGFVGVSFSTQSETTFSSGGLLASLGVDFTHSSPPIPRAK